jgi:hypothetical protein
MAEREDVIPNLDVPDVRFRRLKRSGDKSGTETAQAEREKSA